MRTSTLRHAFGAVAFLLLVGCNFHEVDAGKLYRSAQLDANELETAIKSRGIRTVINLRGNSDSDWYRDEVKVTKAQGVKLIDIGMSAQRLPHRKDLIALLDAYATAKRPILVHCQGGADRTGEASAIYKMLYMGASREDALEMLTPKYMHIEQRFPAKRYFISELWQGEAWARTQYDPCQGGYKFYDFDSAECSATPSPSTPIGEADDT